MTPKYIKPFSALNSCGQIEGTRILARSILFVLLGCLIASFVVPWVQNVHGEGRVIAYNPVDRKTPIRAPVSGVIATWHVQEGQLVTQGQLLAEMRDNDPQLLDRLNQARNAVVDQTKSIESAVAVAEQQVAALTDARDAALVSARLQVRIAEDLLDSANQESIAQAAKVKAAELQQTRQKALNKKGLVSDRALEIAEMNAQTALAEDKQYKAKVRAAQRKVRSSKAYVEEISQKNQAGITKAKAELAKLRAQLSKALEEQTKAETKVAQQERMKIYAPRNGRILSVSAREGTQYLKAGDELAMLVPQNARPAVELWLAGNDGPLVTEGRKVRVNLEGWPAIRFTGWPSASVGTFGGIVDFVDPALRDDGKIRVVVVPDPEAEAWPEQRFLRQGTRARGWVLLNRVTVAYEVWRHINGFPPDLVGEADGNAGSKK